MNDLVLKSVAAGVFFGVWPLIMQKSGVTGNISSLFFAGMALVIIFPFALKSGLTNTPPQAHLMLAALAGILGGIGVLFLNSMLFKVAPTQIGSMLAVMLLAQLLIPMLYQSFVAGGIEIRQLLGVVAAVAAIVLLQK